MRQTVASTVIAALMTVVGTPTWAEDLGTAPFNLKIGGFAVVAPTYEGSEDYEVKGFPLIAPAGGLGEGRVQFRGPDDLRFRVLDVDGFEAGPLIGYRFSREEDDAERLRGLGDVDGGLVVGGYAAYRAGWLKPYVSYHHQVTGEDAGALLRFGAEARHEMGSALALTVMAGASYADDDFMDAYFSVDAAQSRASAAGLGIYDAEAGVKDVFLGLSVDVPLSERFELKIAGKYSRLVGDAADSPIVETEDQFSGGLGITYRLGR
jgi:outer membrane scaffolding protein for murein synthesis (MipA/OmpV family)